MPAALPRGVIRYRGLYRVRVTFQGTRTLIGDYAKLSDAKAALAIAQSDIARGIFVPPCVQRSDARREREEARAKAKAYAASRLTVSQWADTWLDILRRLDRADSTLVSYRSTLRVHILPVLGHKPLDEVTQADVDRLLNSHVGKGARTNIARTLRSLYLAAIKERAGELTSVPFHLRVPSPARTSVLDPSKVATPEQVRALSDAMPPHLALAPMLAAIMSLRLGEVLGLQRGDFEGLNTPGQATVTISRQWNPKTAGGASYTPPKAGSSGMLALPDVLTVLVKEHLEQWVDSDEHAPLFTAQRDRTRPLAQSAFDRAWRAAREQAGMPGYRFHDLRHTGLTMYARTGATLAEIMARGRHKHPDVAVRYQHATLERDRANAAALGEAFK